MIKIIYIGNDLADGNPTTIKSLSKLLDETNHDVVIFSGKKNKLYRLADMMLGVLKFRKSDFILIDVYSTLNFYYTFIISQLARLLNLKFITILHGGNLPVRIKKSPRLSKLIFKYAYKIVAPSKFLQESFNHIGYPTKYIPNPIELSKYKFLKRDNLKPNLLWVRAFQNIYNPEMAILVLFGIKKQYPKATLCMVGPDKEGSLSKLKKLALKYNLLDSIEFTGYLNKQEWIQKSVNYDIFINTSIVDNIPTSVIEAMALGLPVVTTNVGGMPFLINHTKNGLLVKNNNTDEMINQIIYLLENKEIAERISDNARTRIADFDTAIVKKQWLKLLNEC